MAQAALNALRPEMSPFPSDRPSGKTCVVCNQTIFRWEPLKYCRELLWNKNVGEFLIKFEIVHSSKVSLDSTICHHCWHFVTTADKASSIVDENVFMLRARVKRNGGGGGGGGEQASDWNGLEKNGLETGAPRGTRPKQQPASPKDLPKRETRRSNPTSNGPDASPVPVPRQKQKRTRKSSPASSTKSASSTRQRPRTDSGLSGLGTCRVVVPGLSTKSCGSCGETFAYETSEQKADFHSHEKTHLRTFRKGASSGSASQPTQVENERQRRSTASVAAKKIAASSSASSVAGSGKKARALRSTSASRESPDDTAEPVATTPPSLGEFSCEHCSRTFGSRKAVNLHFTYVHPNLPKPGPHKCVGCRRLFFTSKGLKLHANRGCPELKKNKKRKPLLNGSLPNGAAEEPPVRSGASPSNTLVKCKKCSKIVPRNALKAHMMGAHNPKKQKKRGIALGSAKTGKLKKMIKKKTTGRQEVKQRTEEAVNVDLQPAVIVSELSVEDVAEQPMEDSVDVDVDPLYEAETSTINYECHCCGEVFTNSYSLTDHVRRSHGPVEPVPSVGTNGVDQLEATGEFKCTACDSLFHAKVARDTHASKAHKKSCACCHDLFKAREDESQIPGFCDICNKDVAHKNAHSVWLHEEVRRCYRCNMEFGALETFEYHVAEQCPAADNGGEGEESTEDVDFAEFPEESASVEVSTVEVQPGPTNAVVSNGFTCRFCPASFTCSEERLRHMTNSHWSCIKCPEIFADRAEFTEHLKTHVGSSI